MSKKKNIEGLFAKFMKNVIQKLIEVMLPKYAAKGEHVGSVCKIHMKM